MDHLAKQPFVIFQKNHALLSSLSRKLVLIKTCVNSFVLKTFPSIFYSEHCVVDSLKLIFTSNYYKILNKTMQWLCRHNKIAIRGSRRENGKCLWGTKCLLRARHSPKHCATKIDGGMRSGYLIRKADM